MDYKYIEQLLERYWECDTTLEEEAILRTFFSQKDVPVTLLPYKDLFTYAHDEVAHEHLGADFDSRILAMVGETEPVKARTIRLTQRLKPLFRAAAIVAIVLTVGNAMQVALTHPSGESVADGDQYSIDGPSVAQADTARIDSVAQVEQLIIK